MKPSAQHIILMNKFAEALNQLLDGATWRQYRVEGYMPLNIENLLNGCISLSHYGEQNGDLMRDPEVVFKLHTTEAGTELAFPVYYRNDYAGVESGDYWTIEDKRFPLNPSLVEFCSTWFRNLQDQGYVGGDAKIIGGAK